MVPRNSTGVYVPANKYRPYNIAAAGSILHTTVSQLCCCCCCCCRCCCCCCCYFCCFVVFVFFLSSGGLVELKLKLHTFVNPTRYTARAQRAAGTIEGPLPTTVLMLPTLRRHYMTTHSVSKYKKYKKKKNEKRKTKNEKENVCMFIATSQRSSHFWEGLWERQTLAQL